MHVLAVLAAAVLFGTTGTAQALGPQDTTPLSVGAIRVAVGGTVLAIVAFALARRSARHTTVSPFGRTPRRLRLTTLGLMATTGVCLAVYQPLFFLGTQRNGVAVSTVIALGSAPIIAGLLEWALTRRVPSLTWMLATGAATVGVVLLGVGGAATSTGTGAIDPIGLLGAIGAGASFAVIANVQRRLLMDGWGSFVVVGAMGAGSAIIAMIALPFLDLTWLADPAGLTMALWLGIATICLAYALFTWGLSGLTAATAATLTLGEPLTATVLGVTVLGERLSAGAIVGIAVLGAGLAVLAWGSRIPKDPRPFAVEG